MRPLERMAVIEPAHYFQFYLGLPDDEFSDILLGYVPSRYCGHSQILRFEGFDSSPHGIHRFLIIYLTEALPEELQSLGIVVNVPHSSPDVHAHTPQ